jgi:hypothetical protein
MQTGFGGGYWFLNMPGTNWYWDFFSNLPPCLVLALGWKADFWLVWGRVYYIYIRFLPKHVLVTRLVFVSYPYQLQYQSIWSSEGSSLVPAQHFVATLTNNNYYRSFCGILTTVSESKQHPDSNSIYPRNLGLCARPFRWRGAFFLSFHHPLEWCVFYIVPVLFFLGKYSQKVMKTLPTIAKKKKKKKTPK